MRKGKIRYIPQLLWTLELFWFLGTAFTHEESLHFCSKNAPIGFLRFSVFSGRCKRSTLLGSGRKSAQCPLLWLLNCHPSAVGRSTRECAKRDRCCERTVVASRISWRYGRWAVRRYPAQRPHAGQATRGSHARVAGGAPTCRRDA